MSGTSSSGQKLRIGLFGAGVVGGGVVELLQKYTANGRFSKMGIEMEIAKIFIRSLDKPRNFSLPSDVSFVTENIDEILNDDSINCIVEVIGGVGLAKDVVFKAIMRNKHVVTANKALLATYLSEIEDLLAAHPTVRFNFEAAVCGGIPLIRTLQRCFGMDSVSSFYGIMNGTTNFILSKMVSDPSLSYQDVVQEAQRLGYAEADPSADVEGWDVQAKMILCSKLLFGKNLSANSTPPCTGITQITQADFHYAKNHLQSTIKLLGSLTMLPTQDGQPQQFTVYVTPTLVQLTSPWAKVDGPYNNVHLQSENLENLWLSGPGAGRLATANSVVTDLLDIAESSTACKPFPMPAREELVFTENYLSRFYVRWTLSSFDSAKATLLLMQVTQSCLDHAVSVKSLSFHDSNSAASTSSVDRTVLLVMLTESQTQHRNVSALVQSLRQSVTAADLSAGALVMTLLE